MQIISNFTESMDLYQLITQGSNETTRRADHRCWELFRFKPFMCSIAFFLFYFILFYFLMMKVANATYIKGVRTNRELVIQSAHLLLGMKNLDCEFTPTTGGPLPLLLFFFSNEF